ncbi:MAG: hypothetical protein AB8G22_14495 [Saprospiraceae bacterium]
MSKKKNTKTFQELLKEAETIRDFLDLANNKLKISPKAKAAVKEVVAKSKKEGTYPHYNKGA